jgi:hypothetical protein
MAADSITAVATCVVAIATLVGVIIASFGLQTWRAQLEGAAHFDLARRLLLAVYEVQEAVDNVRHPFLSSAEAVGGDNDVPWEITAYENRWSSVRAAMVRVQAATRETIVLWETPVTPLVETLSEQVGELFDVVAAIVDVKRNTADAERLTTEQQAVLYARGRDDAYSKGLRSTVGRFEHYVAPHLPQKRRHLVRLG